MTLQLVEYLTFETSLILLTMVVSYKLYKLRCDTSGQSNCSEWFKLNFKTHNPGGNDTELDTRVSNLNTEV